MKLLTFMTAGTFLLWPIAAWCVLDNPIFSAGLTVFCLCHFMLALEWAG